ncbi:MAG: hypothetical protein ACREPT_04540 [Rudaea sp.]
MAAAAAASGQHQLALALVAGFHERFPLHPDMLRNCLLGAKILSERLSQETNARALLMLARNERPHDPPLSKSTPVWPSSNGFPQCGAAFSPERMVPHCASNAG